LVYELKETLIDLDNGHFKRTQVVHNKEKNVDIEKEVMENLNQMNKGLIKETS